MSIKLKVVNPINYPGWDYSLISSKHCSFFHSSFWAKVLVESYRYKPVYFRLFNKKLSILIPIMEINSFLTGKRGVSLPFSDYCEPIISKKNHFQTILNHIIQYGNQAGWESLELRGGERLYKDILPSRSYYVHNLDLTQNEQQIFSNFKSKTRRNIKKAIKEGVEISICNSLDSIKEFYKLNCMTRKFHGLPPQTFCFFEKIYSYIISQNKGFVILASHLKKNIAGAVFFHFGKNVIFKYGAFDRNYRHLKPNNLVIWEAIKWCIQNGFKDLSFGRTDPKHAGLLYFKRGWGPKEKTIKYFKYDFKKNTFIKDDDNSLISYLFLNKVPIPVLCLISYLLYRHVG